MAASTRRAIRDRTSDYVRVTGLHPSFFTGAASLWDFAGLLSPRVHITPEALRKSADQALAEDWEAVGRAMWQALSADPPR